MWSGGIMHGRDSRYGETDCYQFAATSASPRNDASSTASFYVWVWSEKIVASDKRRLPMSFSKRVVVGMLAGAAVLVGAGFFLV
jgi:hypothetical protein